MYRGTYILDTETQTGDWKEEEFGVEVSRPDIHTDFICRIELAFSVRFIP